MNRVISLQMYGDHLGGMNVMSSASGTPIEVADYYPFGTQRIHTGSFTEQRKFTGHEYDATSDLTYANARYYDQDLGRFLSQDPVFQDLGVDQRTQLALVNPQLQNSYAYAASNPIKNTDKEGEFLDTLLDIGFIAYDLYSLGNAALTGGDVKTEATALGADVLGALIPGGTGFGLGVRALRAADNAADAAKAAGSANDAYKTAVEGGRHAGFLKNYMNKSEGELQKGVNSLQKQIDLHKSKIADPGKHYPEWNKLSPGEQKANLEKTWPNEIKNYSEQRDILKGVLDQKK